MPALAHHQHAVADADDLRQLARDHDDADAVAGELVDEAVDFGLGADIDAAGRLVEDQHLGLGLEQAREQHLLLIAAGQAADGHQRLAATRMPSARMALPPGSALPAQVEDAAHARIPAEHADVHVLAAR